MSKNFIDMLIKSKDLKNSLCSSINHSFLYYSNKIEDGTFTTEELELLFCDSEDLYRESQNLCDVRYYKPLTKYLESLPDFRVEYKQLWDFE